MSITAAAKESYVRVRWYLTAASATTALSLSLAATPAAAIYGGTYTDRYDGIAAIHVDGNYLCTGSIVDQYWILTAKHCLYDNDSNRFANSRLSVRVKSLDRSSGGGVVHVVTSRVRTNHDIAMLKLDRSANADTVRLPTKTTYVPATNYVYGWGKTCNTCEPSRYLKRAELEVTSIDAFDAYLGRGIEHKYKTGIYCKGDSGAPVFKLVEGKRYQVGVVSWGLSCDGLNPAYSATVPTSRDWILNVMATV